MTHVLLLGGTSDASLLARRLHQDAVPALFSYAGATRSPAAQPLPTRCGGFGGVPGLVQFIRTHGVSHVVDATHPFAAQMSRNTCAACAQTRTPLLALERPAWQPEAGDRWVTVPDMDAAARALPTAPTRVFLAVGRKQLAAFAPLAQHRYLLRVVDMPEPGSLPVQGAMVLVARGPFGTEGERALLTEHRIEWLVTKNAGGEATRGKLEAARALGLPVIMVQRPDVPARCSTDSVDRVMHWLAHEGVAGAMPSMP